MLYFPHQFTSRADGIGRYIVGPPNWYQFGELDKSAALRQLVGGDSPDVGLSPNCHFNSSSITAIPVARHPLTPSFIDGLVCRRHQSPLLRQVGDVPDGTL